MMNPTEKKFGFTRAQIMVVQWAAREGSFNSLRTKGPLQLCAPR
jgi:hypothetical protein